jgi:hypothetical protein
MASPVIQTGTLSGRRLQAAMLVADGHLTNVQIAADVGVTPQTLAKWKRREDFRAEVERIRTIVRDEVLHQGIALKVNRLKALNDRVNRIERIMEERAADPAMQNIPGGKTGLIKRTLKSIGSGASATIIEEFEFDATLSKEYLAVLEQSEEEMSGKFEEAKPNGGPGDRPRVQINYPVLSAEALKAMEESAVTIDLPRGVRRLLER